WKVNVGATETITGPDGACRKVTNNSASDIFVPIKTAAEWQAFISNHPATVALAECTEYIKEWTDWSDCNCKANKERSLICNAYESGIKIESDVSCSLCGGGCITESEDCPGGTWKYIGLRDDIGGGSAPHCGGSCWASPPDTAFPAGTACPRIGCQCQNVGAGCLDPVYECVE
ncbi:MAG: hypothetical protein WC478_02265, partial [Candidatus Omnitrophota bacterium]